MSASWDVLKRDKAILLFPLLSGLCCLLVLASFVIPIWLTGAVQASADESRRAPTVLYYALIFFFYLANYFVITFFNAAIVSCAVLRMTGANPTVSDGFRDAAARLPQIAGWAFLSATVGLVLRVIEDRSDKIGRIVAGLLGMAWTVVSFLVVPILIVERKGPLDALRSSTALLKKTWGEQIIGDFSFGGVFMILAIPGIALIAFGILSASTIALALCVAIAAVYFVALSLIQSALQSIFQAALYLYARDGGEPKAFAGGLLPNAMRPR
jgi:hypothetical protein